MKNHIETNSERPFRPGCKTRQQMAAEFEWTVQNLRTKLRKANIEPPSGSIPPKWQKAIYKEFGYPPSVSKETYKGV